MTDLMHNIVKLEDGNRMPLEGFGVYKLDTPELMETAIKQAFNSGYRLFDTAQLYHNEELLGHTFQQLALPRNELFLTTKIGESNQGYDETLRSTEKSLKKLQTDYLDLLLVHWPIYTHFFDTWRAMERLKAEGIVRSIGVSNYHRTHLEYLATKANEQPVVNQIENHPYLSQPTMLAYNQAMHIVTQAWSPLGRGAVLKDPVISKIATALNKSTAQIILRWHLQRGISFIPKSKNPDRIIQNTAIHDFTLSAIQMAQIDALNRNERTGRDPELVYEMTYQY